MLGSGKRSAPRNGVIAAGSVWESRMKVDEGKGGVKVFNAEEEGGGGGGGGGGGLRVYRRLKRNQSSITAVNEKKKTWKSAADEKSPIQIRKTKSDSHRYENERIEKHPTIQIRKCRSDPNPNPDPEACKELGVVCTEKKINSSDVNNAGQIETHFLPVAGDDDHEGVAGTVDEQKREQEEAQDDEEEELGNEDEEIDTMVKEKDNFEVKEMNLPLPEQKPQPQKTVNEKEEEEEKKLDQIHGKPVPSSSNARKLQPNVVVDRPATTQEFVKPPPIVISDEFVKFPHTQNKLQNIVDLVMWKDVSKSALVFGIGTFILLSSSFTKDLNISVISATSYLGLFYLAAVFIYKSILCRGGTSIDIEESSHIYLVGEEDAIWLLHLILPYLNEFLLKLRRLFSGDPATTMKLAVMLFVLARCGGSIAIWNVAKLGFFGVFTLPKVYSSYSTQLSGYGMFWIRRFRDAWDSCSHKKAVAAAVFTVVWNLSSVTARVWAAFMLLVAFRYYQQALLKDGERWQEEEVEIGGPSSVDTAKEKKGE